MTLRVELITETAKARLYRFSDGAKEWVPKSVIRSMVKFGPSNPLDRIGPEIHELEIEEWWLRQRGYLDDSDDDQDEFDWFP